MHEGAIRAEFTHQAESFAASGAATDRRVLDAIIALADPRPRERWLEVACGPGIIARRLAPSVESAHGVDLTPAMIELAAREAIREGLDNVTFSLGDATALPWPDGSFDGAVTRFSVHHIPVPGRMLAEFARVLASGGRAVVADHLADTGAGEAAWALEVERVRDPSHWANLDAARLHRRARESGLRVETETVVPLELDLDDWIRRGSGDADLVERVLAQRPEGTECFRIGHADGRRTLSLHVWVGRLVRAA